jgi:hypothetical protein
MTRKLSKSAKKRFNDMMEHPKFLYTVITAAWQRLPEDVEDPPVVGGFVLSWAAKGIGFGQITFSQVAKRGKRKKPQRPEVALECHSEAMGAEFVQQALAHWISTMDIKD